MRSNWNVTLLLLVAALGGAACNLSDQAMPDGMGDRPNGAPCGANNQCVSSLCISSVCQANANGMGRANGSGCNAVGDCASGAVAASKPVARSSTAHGPPVQYCTQGARAPTRCGSTQTPKRRTVGSTISLTCPLRHRTRAGPD